MPKNILAALAITTFLFGIFSFGASAQEKLFEYWGDEYFETPIDTTAEEAIRKKSFLKTSAGFFPKPYLRTRSFWITETVGWNYSRGSIEIDELFPTHTSIYSAQPPMKSRDFKKRTREKEKFSDKNKYGFFDNPPDKNANVGFSLEYSIPQIHTIFSAKAGYSNRYIFLYSPIDAKFFLGHNGEKRSFEQISVLEINDKKIYTSFDLKHPIYGAFMRRNDYDMSAFYYLTYGVGCDFSVDAKLSVFEYIISENQNIRYDNGEIKMASLSREKFDGIKKYRYHYNIGVGWQFGATNSNIKFELKYRGSLNSIFEDYDYWQNTLFFTANIDVRAIIDMLKIFGNVLAGRI